MRITFKIEDFLQALLSAFLIASCTNDRIIDNEPDQLVTDTGKSINLAINVPRNSLSTYASEAGSVDENHIDTLFVKILENGTPLDTLKFYGSSLQTTGGSNDSIVKVAFELDNLTGGTVTAEVFANRMHIRPITGEIPLPDQTDKLTWLMMSGEGSLTYNGSAYSGTIHVVRNVAKLRVRVSKHSACIPANLAIKYSDIQIQVQQVPDRTQLMLPPPIHTPAGLSYINYATRTGATLRPEVPFVSFTGGQIDSLYLNENYLNSSAYTDANKTQIKITLPSQEPGFPIKTAEYTYPLYTDGGYQIKRNYIYILDIRVAGQSLDPLVSLDILPWDDIEVDGDINGVTLNLDRSVVNLNPTNTVNNAAIVEYKTDNTSVTLDWSKVNPAHHIDTTVTYIQGMNGEIEIFWTGDGAPDYSFRDTVYITAGNVSKAIELVYNVPGGNFGNWVGTFHRWNQTGERIIKMRNTGEWTATVTQGADFIVLDASGTTDPNWGTPTAHLGNSAGFDSNYPVNSTATSLTGNGIIYFRVGLKSTLAYLGAPPRYGLIEVTSDEGTKRIYVRQGEEADYVMRPQDTNPSDGNNSRSHAVKFSPFNLADPLRGNGGSDTTHHNRISYGDAVFSNNKFVEYPSQAGYFFPWNSSGEYWVTQGYNRAYHPVNPIGAIAHMEYPFSPVTWNKAMEPCPAGYRHPNDEQQSPALSEMRQSLFYTPNSNMDVYGSTPGGNLDNSVWGFYADGLFDRLPIVSSPNGADSTAVSYYASNPADSRNAGIAYIGRLIYNPTTYASLFLPAAGARNGGNGMGPLKGSGQSGMYWTATNYVVAEPASASEWADAFYFTPTAFYGYYSSDGTLVPSGMSIRCVKDGFGLPGSM